MMEPIVSVENFSFKYLRSDLVLKQVNLAIEKGSFTVMIGASGAGKTTLCKAVAGIVPYYTGGDYAGDVKVWLTPCKLSVRPMSLPQKHLC